MQISKNATFSRDISTATVAHVHEEVHILKTMCSGVKSAVVPPSDISPGLNG